MSEAMNRLIEYAYQDDELALEFFEKRMVMLRESVEERLFHIKCREEASARALETMERQQDDKAARLRMLPYHASERTFLMSSIDSLEREKRAEGIRRIRDVAQWSREAREKLEEYQSVAQISFVMKSRERGFRE